MDEERAKMILEMVASITIESQRKGHRLAFASLKRAAVRLREADENGEDPAVVAVELEEMLKEVDRQLTAFFKEYQQTLWLLTSGDPSLGKYFL